MARIGVFVCHCGTNIAGSVDIAKVIAAAQKLPGVVVASDNKYTCSEPGQASVRQSVLDNKLDRVVIAACSPRMHEPTFRRTVASAGLNPFMLEIANIREQVSWVHSGDKDRATEKAIDNIKMAVAKVARHDPLFPREVQITKRALVIGGGITGIQAALDIANSGHEVVLVEREASIGGRMAQLDKTFPTLDCSACILTPKMVDVAQHPKIKLMTLSQVKEVRGFVGNFEVDIVQKAKKVDYVKCTGCGTCWQKCPEKTTSEFDMGMGKRTCIHIPFAQAVPPKPVIDTNICRYIKYQNWVAAGSEGKKPPECRICEKICPTGAIAWEQEDQVVTEKFGAVVVASGFQVYDHKAYGEYGGGDYPDVISGMQLERLMNASGPTGGEILRPSDGTHPHTIAFVCCVGSRDQSKGRTYCSKVCCMYTAKHAIMLKEHDPNVQCYIFYIDVRTGGKDFEEFYLRALDDAGAVYIKGRPSKIYRDGKKMIILAEDGLMGKPIELAADLVVLATGMEPQSDADTLAQTLHISYDTYHFMVEAHPKLRPVETQTDGVFVAGACVGPRDIPESVAHGSAAAAKVTGLFSNNILVTDPAIANVNQARCIGCLLCVAICPYKAISPQVTRDKRVVAEVNESLCKGCGLCAGACRPKAIDLRGFTNQQILEEMTSLWR